MKVGVCVAGVAWCSWGDYDAGAVAINPRNITKSDKYTGYWAGV